MRGISLPAQCVTVTARIKGRYWKIKTFVALFTFIHRQVTLKFSASTSKIKKKKHIPLSEQLTSCWYASLMNLDVIFEVGMLGMHTPMLNSKNQHPIRTIPIIIWRILHNKLHFIP
jgi:hypothetical protein